jgi:tetraacyldisaccharide 4'-kinase
MHLLRQLLFPFSLLYAIIIFVRNYLYDNRILKSTTFTTPVICVGNINTGGTGKTPHVEFCIETLSTHFTVAVLSRGYGRKTKGFVIITEGMAATDCGDEPLQMFAKFKNVSFYVGENRVKAIQQIIEKQNPQVIIMDDGLQHRAVNPSLKIMLTAYYDLFLDEYFLLPAGNLREHKNRARANDVIIISKTPAEATEEEKNKTQKRVDDFLHAYFPGQDIAKTFFSSNSYGLLYHINDVSNKLDFQSLKNYHVITFAALAKPEVFQTYLQNFANQTTHLSFADHYQFTENDLQKLVEVFNATNTSQKIIVTTEKDFARLSHPSLKKIIEQLPVYILPVTVEFTLEDKKTIQELLINHVRENKNNSQVHYR